MSSWIEWKLFVNLSLIIYDIIANKTSIMFSKILIINIWIKYAIVTNISGTFYSTLYSLYTTLWAIRAHFDHANFNQITQLLG